MYLKKIQKLIANKMGLEPQEIEPASDFAEDLNMGELEVMELIEILENEYDIEIADLADSIETVEDLVTILAEELE
ncbi:MAG TPA: acyl carrier protein [candidate division WWE3 bacterium]|uniref:Acyl carrier protein n=1 Tax=candidate division WWE3 bacterium TaxID=2053526 RepID=A0A7C1HYR2_UNCKA|nr:acyl carrier protein [candidate division WWE3 bacterium]